MTSVHVRIRWFLLGLVMWASPFTGCQRRDNNGVETEFEQLVFSSDDEMNNKFETDLQAKIGDSNAWEPSDGTGTSGRVDTGNNIDAWVNVDTEVNTEVNIDTGVKVDTEINMDTGVSVDTGVKVDTEINMDTGVSVDTGVKVDTGANVDTGVTVDTTVIVDTGDDAQLQMVASELLGRPTDSAVTLNVQFNKSVVFGVEWGTVSGKYTDAVATATYSGDDAVEVELDGLSANTQYYYRIKYRDAADSSAGWVFGTEHSFHTQRPPGESFVFTIQADAHMDEQSDEEIYRTTLLNQENDHPDFFIDLGDTSMVEKFCDAQPCVNGRNLLMRRYFSLIGHSSPLFMVMGNHEGGLHKFINGTGESLAVWDDLARINLYANPQPNGFYTGDESLVDFVGHRETWYAFQWGDALFVALDPFWYVYAEKNQFDDKKWNDSLGETQYRWLKETLESSSAKYKFIFIHELLGGTEVAVDHGRGGAEAARLYEWGGEYPDGTWGWDMARPGWEAPIHQLLVDNKVSAVFHGHDHFYAYQQKDGVVYQLVPQPSHPQYKAANNASPYGYVTGTILPNSGHLRVTVSSKETLVEYVRAFKEDIPKQGLYNAMIGDSYTIAPN